MKKVELKICMGTMCYIMGGAHLRAAVDALPLELRTLVEVSYSPCLNLCHAGGEPPYIELNGRTISRVSKPGLIHILKEELKNVVR